MMNRRQFIAVGISVLAGLKSVQAWAMELVKMNKDGSADHPAAKSMGYVADLEKALASPAIIKASGLNMKTKKSKPEAPKDQTCVNCQLYPKKDAKDKGPCQVIPGVLVHGPGSCNTWIKRA